MVRNWRFGPATIVLFSAALWGEQGIAQDDFPQMTDEGLARIDSRFDVLYWRPGATIDHYRRIVLLDCYVEFRDDWLRDQNRGKMSFNKITPEKMALIQERLAEDFVEVTTEALEEDSGFVVAGGAAADVLVLRPAILNLDVSANIYGSGSLLPDESDGASMTLFVEFYDSLTSTLIARAIDARSEPENNQAAARRLIRQWARIVRDTLDEG